ncbi:riboflavin kinase [Coemansia erecta]|uniref:Riboflavin kinase n=1 Tax=Coemansia erecta TaxID=147472 RepID=A0A9W8CP81_9FUNG|nr:riboflavin kinase [Coemansia erecta]
MSSADSAPTGQTETETQTQTQTQPQQRPRIVGPPEPQPPYPILVSGAVVKGFGRGGKQLGIPTANLAEDAVERTLRDIPIGVYLGWAQIAGEPQQQQQQQPVWPMVMSLGWNPYFQNERRSGEVHVIHNFDEDFYGRTLNVAILAYIRPERNYDSLDALIADIHFDIDVAHRSLAREAYQRVKELDFFSAEISKDGSSSSSD